MCLLDGEAYADNFPFDYPVAAISPSRPETLALFAFVEMFPMEQ